MTLEDRIKIFSQLGKIIYDFIYDKNNLSESIISSFDKNIETAENINPWFTKDNIIYRLTTLADELNKENISNWISKYNSEIINLKKCRNIGIVMAGNIPAVGFHDMLCALLCGHKVNIKLSSKDNIIIPFLTELIIDINPEISEYITITQGFIKNSDAIIATGSDNTSQYFEKYFSDIPHIFRKNRNSIAILDGKETKEDLDQLCTDMFQYFGLGCRSVSKLYVPKNYDIKKIFSNAEKWKKLEHHNKWMNNFTYNKAIFSMNREEFLCNNFLIIKQNTSISSPISVIHFEEYKEIESVCQFVDIQKDKLQCIVSKASLPFKTIPFGETQKPTISDYADGIDTVNFLISL